MIAGTPSASRSSVIVIVTALKPESDSKNETQDSLVGADSDLHDLETDLLMKYTNENDSGHGDMKTRDMRGERSMTTSHDMQGKDHLEGIGEQASRLRRKGRGSGTMLLPDQAFSDDRAVWIHLIADRSDFQRGRSTGLQPESTERKSGLHL